MTQTEPTFWDHVDSRSAFVLEGCACQMFDAAAQHHVRCHTEGPLWEETRALQCIALRSGGTRCNQLPHRATPFRARHLAKVEDWFWANLKDRVEESQRDVLIRERKIMFSNSHTDAVIEDATRVLQDSNQRVYFINAANKFVKIGFSKNPEARFQGIRGGSSLIPPSVDRKTIVLMGTIPGGQSVERHLHGVLRKYRAEGEWFRLNKTVRGVVEGLITGDHSQANQVLMKSVSKYLVDVEVSS